MPEALLVVNGDTVFVVFSWDLDSSQRPIPVSCLLCEEIYSPAYISVIFVVICVAGLNSSAWVHSHSLVISYVKNVFLSVCAYLC